MSATERRKKKKAKRQAKKDKSKNTGGTKPIDSFFKSGERKADDNSTPKQSSSCQRLRSPPTPLDESKAQKKCKAGETATSADDQYDAGDGDDDDDDSCSSSSSETDTN